MSGLGVYNLFIGDSSTRVVSGRHEFSRSLGGVLVIPGGNLFPTATFARELFWNSLSGVLYVRNETNTSWIGLSGIDSNASYVTLNATGSLPNERVLTAGTGVRITDGGSTVTVGVNDNVVATITGSLFTGPVSASAGLSGSLQRVGPNLSYLVAGTGIAVMSQSNGQIIISSSAGASSADSNATYVLLSATASLPNERVLTTSGSSLTLTDGGAGTTVTLDLANTGTAGTYGDIQVNSKGQVTSGSTGWFGKNFWFVSGSYAVPFHNSTTTYLSALNMTASNLDAGIYRLGWSYTYRCNTTAQSFRARCFILNSASYDIVEEVSDVAANERHMRSGFAYVRVTGSVALFSLDMSIEAAATNTTASMYGRALELWRVS
jgi:hypothetical protein